MLAGFEVGCGIGLLLRGAVVRWATVAILGFFVFILLLGYGMPQPDPARDLLVNRLFTLVMAALVVPLLTGPPPEGVVTAWRRVFTG